jgi:hypothetical protein
MNRLKDLNFYLAGPIDFAENLGSDWRDSITPFLESKNVKVFNPLKPIFHGSKEFDIKRPELDIMRENEDYELLRQEVRNVIRWDLRAVDLSSCIIVNYDINIHQCGTMEEIFMANAEQSKPVLFHVNNAKNKLPKWLYGRFPHQHLFNTWEELKDYITRIDSDPDFKFYDYEMKRWMFFAGEHMK